MHLTHRSKNIKGYCFIVLEHLITLNSSSKRDRNLHPNENLGDINKNASLSKAAKL